MNMRDEGTYSLGFFSVNHWRKTRWIQQVGHAHEDLSYIHPNEEQQFLIIVIHFIILLQTEPP